MATWQLTKNRADGKWDPTWLGGLLIVASCIVVGYVAHLLLSAAGL